MDVNIDRNLGEALAISPDKSSSGSDAMPGPGRHARGYMTRPLDVDDFIKDCPPDIVQKLMPIIEERDNLREENAQYARRIKDLEDKSAKHPLYSCITSESFISECTKRQDFCLRNSINASLSMVSLNNFEYIRSEKGIKAARDKLSRISHFMLPLLRQADLLGYVFEGSFGVFIPFMTGAEAGSFIKGMRRQIIEADNDMEIRIASSDAGNKDIKDTLYALDAKIKEAGSIVCLI